MHQTRTVAEQIEGPRGRREPGTRTMAELTRDPRYIAARQQASENLRKDIRKGDRDDGYRPPNKPLGRYTEEELHEAVHRCGYCSGQGYVKFDVPDTDRRFGRAYPCQSCGEFSSELRSRKAIARLRPIIDQYSMLRGQLLQKTFLNFDKTRSDSARQARASVHLWAQNIVTQSPDALPWLFVYGPTGVGKTHLAAAAANGLSEKHIPVVFTTFPQLLGMVTADHFDKTEPAIQALQAIPVLILDDIRDDNLKSAWACSVLFRILDHRYITQSPTMVVSNHPLVNHDPTRHQSTIREFEPRVASRLGDTAISKTLTVAGEDFRTS